MVQLNLNLSNSRSLNPVSAISNSIIGVILGIILIIGWLPLIVWNELRVKKKKEQLKQLTLNLNIPRNKNSIIIGTIDGTALVATNFTEQQTLTSTRTKTIPAGYLFIQQTGYLTITQPDPKNTSTTNTISSEKLASNFSNAAPNIKFKTDDSSKQIDFNDLIDLCNEIDSTTVVYITTDSSPKTYTYTYKYSAITNGVSIADLTGIQAVALTTDDTLPKYMYATSADDAVTQIIKDQDYEDTFMKWLLRGVSVLMLSGGLSMLISPIRLILQNSLFGIGNAILGLYDILGLFASIILTVILTFIVYGLINYTWQISIFVTLLVGLIIFFQNKKK